MVTLQRFIVVRTYSTDHIMETGQSEYTLPVMVYGMMIAIAHRSAIAPILVVCLDPCVPNVLQRASKE